VRIFLSFLLVLLLSSSLGARATEPASDGGAQTEATASETAMPAEQAKALADLLRDPAARDALIQQLEGMAANGAAEPASDAAAAAAEGVVPDNRPQSIGRVIAEATQGFVSDVVDGASELGQRLLDAPSLFAGLNSGETGVLLDAFRDLLLIIVVTVATFFALRAISKRLDRRIGARAAAKGMIETVALVLVSLMLDVAVVLIAWAVGYALATLAFGEFGAVGIRQALYLNAFLVVELVKVGVRTILSPTTAALRPISIPDGGARRLNVWISVIVSVLGYGQLLVVPVVNQHVSWLAGQGVGVLISLAALSLLAALTLIHRGRVADWLLSARHMADGPSWARFLARNWHVPVMIYLAALFLIVLTRPGAILLPVLGASAQILGAIVLGSIAASAISRSIRSGVHLPPSVNARLPLLERRLNAFVPKALSILQLLIIFSVIAFALHTIGVIDLRSWLAGQVGAEATSVVVSVLFILLGSFLVWLAVSSYIDYRLNPDYGEAPTARARTLLSLAKNAVTIVLLAVTLMFVLSEIGIDIAPLIASAGVIGLAIGFGAQKMVQDIITGIFIQFENAMNVGDVVSVGGTTGTVERLTIRSVSLRDVQGIFHIIPFSSVDMVSNYMREYSHFVCDMGIAYREDIEEAKQAMFDAFEELRGSDEWGPSILEDMTWFGLHAFGDSAIVLRSRIKCAPGKQWGVGRAYNAILKRVFDERGIEIPFPHQTIYFGEDKRGKAPVAHIAIAHESAAKDAPEEASQDDAAGGDDGPETSKLQDP